MNRFILLVLQLSVGPLGNAETKLVSIKKLLRNTMEVIMHACSFMSYWSGLYAAESQGRVLEGIKVMLGVACRC